MAGDVVLTGEIPAEGVGALLRTLEEQRISGVLCFDCEGARREVALLAGSLVEAAPGAGDDDALESLLGAQSGRYEVLARLPPLPVSQGDARVRTGSLAVHVPADLMGWCERAGLTGTLALLHDGEQAEARYERGELVEIQVVGGAHEGDLGAVFAWDEGSFRVEADAIDARKGLAADADGARAPSEQAIVEVQPVADAPMVEAALPAVPRPARGRDEATVPIVQPRAPRRDDTGQRFLRVVETTLGAIVDQAEKQRAPSRSSPPQPLPTVRPLSVPPPPRAPREATVRIVYLSGETTPLDEARRRETPSRTPSNGGASHDREMVAVRPDSVAISVGGLLVAIALVAGLAAYLLRAH